MNIKLSAVGVLASALFFSACSDDKHSIISQDGCDVVQSYAEGFKAKSSISVAIKYFPNADELWIVTPQSIESFLKQRPEFKGDPALPLERKLAAVRDVSVVGSCPKLQRWYKNTSTALDDSAFDTFAKKMPTLDNPSRKYLENAILEMSAPAISDDGNTAYFHTAEATRTTGGRFAVTYKRNAEGKWRLDGKQPFGHGIP